jgi:hypothetical protein
MPDKAQEGLSRSAEQYVRRDRREVLPDPAHCQAAVYRQILEHTRIEEQR